VSELEIESESGLLVVLVEEVHEKNWMKEISFSWDIHPQSYSGVWNEGTNPNSRDFPNLG
jgi:hypothetical protein